MKFTRIPETTFKNIQLNAGILVRSFNPATQEITGLLGATTGGLNFKATPTFEDFGEDIDNCPKNTLELKKLTAWEVLMSGTFVTITAGTAKTLIGAADIDEFDPTKIIPRNDILISDYEDLWWVGDYSDANNGANAGYCAIHMLNGLNTGGFQIKSNDKGKGNFAFEFTGHYSMNAQETVPFEVYIKMGGEVPTPSILLNKHSLTIEDEGTAALTAVTVPEGETITWSSANDTIATVTDGVVTGEAEGNTIITASITVDGVTYTDTCTVIVTAAE